MEFKLPKPKLKLRQNGGGGRSFRLSPLELMLGGLIVVGLMYLLTIWVGGMLESSPAASTQAGANLPAGQLDRAIVASERTQLQVKGLNAKVDQLNKRLEQVAGAKEKAQAKSPKGLARRMSKLEKQVAALNKSRKAKKPASDPKLNARLNKMEKSLAALSKAQKASPKQTAPPQLSARLDGLEKQVAALAKAPAKAPGGAVAPDPALQKKVEGLGQTLSAVTVSLGKAQRGEARTAARLAALDKKLAVLEQSPAGAARALDANAVARLAALEAQVSALGKTPPAKAPELDPQSAARLGTLERQINTLAKAQRTQKPPKADPKTTAKLKAVERELSALKRAQATPDANTAKRLALVERSLAQLRSSRRVVRSPMPAPETTITQERLARQMAELETKQRALDNQIKRLSRATAGSATARRTAAATSSRPTASRATSSRRVVASTPKTRKVVHRVTRGQTLYGLARRYRVKVSQVRAWNPKLRGRDRNKLYIGEKLTFYTSR
jgi:LysM repeat protein